MVREFETIYRQHRQGLFSLALSILRNVARAEDAVHTAFVNLLRRNHRPSNNLVSYVYAAVRNAAVDLQRQEAAMLARRDGSLYQEPPDDPASGAVHAERLSLLAEAIDALPQDQREAIVLRMHAGLTFEQIGQTTGESKNTVAARYRRGLERLRELLKERV